MKGRIQAVEATYFVHMTEDGERVEAAVARLLSAEGGADSEELEGHFGNRIQRSRFHLTGEGAERAVASISRALSKGARAEIIAGLAGLIDEHSALFLRFDKQAVVRGRLVLGGADPVRVKVKPRGFVPKGTASEFYAAVLSEKEIA